MRLRGGCLLLIRRGGWRRQRRFAGSNGGSGVASSGVTPDPVTAIRAVTGSGVDAGPGGDRLAHTSFLLSKARGSGRGPAAAPRTATWPLPARATSERSRASLSRVRYGNRRPVL